MASTALLLSGFLFLVLCCPGCLQLHLGSFVPTIFGGTGGFGFGHQGGGGGGGGGVLGFNPLGVVQNILSSIPGGRTALGAAGLLPPSNAVGPHGGGSGGGNSFWNPESPGYYPPFGGSFMPNGFGGQAGFGTGQGIPGPQMPPLAGDFPSGMPSMPGIGTNQGPQVPPLSGGIPSGGPVFPGGGGGLGPNLPQPQPPLSQGPNLQPPLPGQGNIPVGPTGTGNVNPTTDSCLGTGCDGNEGGGDSGEGLIDPRSSRGSSARLSGRAYPSASFSHGRRL